MSARTIATLPAPTPLIATFAADRLGVAAPLLATARLTAAEWAEVSRAASPECRRFIDSLEAQSSPAAPDAVVTELGKLPDGDTFERIGDVVRALGYPTET